MNSRLNKLTKMAKTFIDKQNSPAVLVGVAVVGVIGTAVAAYKTGLKADKILKEYKRDFRDTAEDDKETQKELKKKAIKKIIPAAVPPVLLGTTTIACILSSHKINARRIALLSAAYQLSESAVKDLNEKMIETLGEKKTRVIKDNIVKDKIEKNPPKEGNIYITGDGDVLCYDTQSGRYFKSNAQKIRQSMLEISAQIQNEGSATLNDFYYLIGLPNVESGDKLGWTTTDLDGGIIKIDLVACMRKDKDEPCMGLEYDANVLAYGRSW